MTLVALEWLLTCVGADVALQEPGSAERLAADFTLTRQRMRSHMHLQGALRLVLLLAVLAAEIVVLVPD